MKCSSTAIPDVLVLEPDVFEDRRGFTYQSHSVARFREVTGLDPVFVQDNHSRSVRGVVRGLHYQLPQSQAKLVRCVAGEVLDVAVDIRRSSPTFGRWVGVRLSAENRRQLWIPEGFAHGFAVISELADVLYKVTALYAPEHERGIRWDDPQLAIDWEVSLPPLLSDRDAAAPPFAEAVVFP